MTPITEVVAAATLGGLNRALQKPWCCSTTLHVESASRRPKEAPSARGVAAAAVAGPPAATPPGHCPSETTRITGPEDAATSGTWNAARGRRDEAVVALSCYTSLH